MRKGRARVSSYLPLLCSAAFVQFLSLCLLLSCSFLPPALRIVLLGQPPSSINSHHEPPSLRQINHTVSESELNAMSKYSFCTMKGDYECLTSARRNSRLLIRENFYSQHWIIYIIFR